MPILTSEERLGGRVASRYRLEAVLGSGGMGVLFRGLDEATETAVAIKMLKPTDSVEPDRIARFLRETQIAAMLRHPHIASVLDSGSDETGTPFLVMELLEGRSLEQELGERGVLSFGEALSVVIPIANALAAAHTLGVIHRDVKPSNIFLSRDSTGRVVPKLLDFGIARSAKDAFETRTGVFVGTPGYVAPEQAREEECGPFTDVWGVGAVLYRCLTGRPPHSGDSLPEMLARLVRESVPPLVASGVKRSACATIDRALERDPQSRHQTMRAFIRALEMASASNADDSVTDEMPGVATAAFETPRPISGAEAKEAGRGAVGARSLRLVRRAPGFIALGVLVLLATIAPRSNHSESLDPAPVRGSDRKTKQSAIPTMNVVPIDAPAVVPNGEVGAAISLESPPRWLVPPPARARPVHRVRAVAVAPPAASAVAVAPSSASEPERERSTGLPVANEW